MITNTLNSHVIYSDGACSGNPGPGGWAFILWSPDNHVLERSGFQPATTNNRMEMSAALEGIRSVVSGSPIIVLTDSVYLIRGITQWIFGWQKRGWKNAEGKDILNRDLWEELWQATRGKKIEWRYVPGHKGFAGNERVDALAVAQSLKRPLSHFHGPFENYSIEILPLPTPLPLPEMKKMGSAPKSNAAAFYLSLVNGVLEQHSTWDQCQRRVKGVPNVRFKKVQSEQEAVEVIKSWGLSPDRLALKR